MAEIVAFIEYMEFALGMPLGLLLSIPVALATALHISKKHEAEKQSRLASERSR